MAQNIGEAQINLSVNTSQMEREVSAALKRLESRGFNIGQGINARSFTQPLGRITGAANEFQKSLDASNARVIAFGASAGAIYNVQRAFSALITSTIEVQKSLTDINVILGASQKTLGQFGDQLFEIARNSGQAFSTVATAAGELARQGLSLEQTLKRTSDALILARLSGLDAASSVEALTASINSFNQSALDSTQIVNKLASVDAAFAVSSADLAEALKRVGSSAQDVGVSFDELLAIVASVNQTTARGGAVIGNSLKTIFTRVQRTDVLNQLEALGIAVRDLQGNTAPAIQILTGLAQKFDELGSAQKSQIAELVGGVFQINILKAALGDLSKEYSTYGNALKIASGATNEAISRNEELNKTLAALLNRTLANLTKVGSEIGALTLQPAIEKVLGGLNSALESFDIKGDSVGSKIGKGIFEGIGSFISGPGLALLIGVFGKIFLNLTKFTTDAVKTLLGLNKNAQAQAQIQERINNILAQNPQLVQNILNKQVSLLQVEKDILTVIQAQSRARQQSTAIATTITRGLMSRGVTAEKGLITTKEKSRGFIPNYSANREIMGAISGGYMPGQVRSMNIPNYGRVTYNTAEEVKRFSGLSQPGIMPPEQSEAGKAYKQKFKDKYGIDPYASKGFIPNFVGRPTTKAQTDLMIKQGYVKASGNELKQYLDTKEGKIEGAKLGVTERYGSYWVPEGKYTKLILNSKANLERIAKEQGGKYARPYALVYPGFKESMAFAISGTAKGLKNPVGFYAVPFPGELKSKKNTMVGPGIYGNALNALIDSSSKFLTGLAGVSPQVVKTAEFKRYLRSNISQDQIGSLVGNAFEGGILAALNIVPSDRTRTLDLTPKELTQLGNTFKIPYLTNHSYTGGGDFKSSLSRENRNSMAEKIIANSMNKALGFIPNFSPIEKALKTEKMMGGKGVLDYQQGIGLYVRDGKTQPNFASVMRDHPEGIQTATKNSKIMQGMVSKGFIPNFAPAGFDPMTLYFLATSFLQGGQQSKENLASAEAKLADIVNQRGEVENQILKEQNKSKPNQKKLNELANKKIAIESDLISQQREVASQTPVFARRGGSFVGGIGGVTGRFASRYGTGLALAAPVVSGIASQFVGDEVTRGGRAAKAGVQGIGDIASYAALGGVIGSAVPGLGTAAGAIIGGGIGAISTTISAVKEFNDIMPELKRSAEQAQERLNNVNSTTQLLSSSLETLSSIQTNTSLSAEQAAKLQQKATEDFALSVARLDSILPGAGKEIEELYRKFGNTTELRTKISELQAEAQKESQALITRTALVSRSKGLETLTTPGALSRLNIFRGMALEGEAVQRLSEEERRQFLIESRISGVQGPATKKYKQIYSSLEREQNLTRLSEADRRQYQADIFAGSQEIKAFLDNLSSTGKAIDSSQIKALSEGFRNNDIPKIESTLKSMVKTGDLALAQETLNLIKPEILNSYFQKWLEIQQKTEEFNKQLEIETKARSQGKRDITDIEQLRQAFQTGTLTPEALGRIKYEQMIGTGPTVGLRGKGSEALAGTTIDQFMTLGQEIGNTSGGMQKMQQFIESANQANKDYKDGLISLTQATERVKLEFDKIMFQQEGGRMFSGERAQARQDILNAALRQGKLEEGFKPVTSFFDRFGDNAQTTARKINESFANLAENMQTGFEDAFGAFIDGTKTAEDALRDMALSISQQFIKEQFSIGMRSLLGGLTGGGGFGGTTDNSGGLLGGIFNSIFGGGKAKGGIIKKYSGGGYVDGGSGVKDDVPAMLTDGEYVLRKSAVNKYGIDALNMLNRGGMIKGYAGGGGVNSMLSNRYDFYGAQGELLTRPYTEEAFKTTVNAPEELSNIPALTGKFNISDLLSTRAITDENNPMNQLRSQRFGSMQNYQQQVSNFKTSYNEQMRQVEEMRRKAQEEADRINSERMAAYNRSVTQGFIGGLLGVGMGLFGSMASVGKFGPGLGSLFGGGGGGGSMAGGAGGGIFNPFGIGGAPSTGFSFAGMGDKFLGFFQDIGKSVMGAFGGGGGGGTIGGMSDEQMKAIKRQVEMGQLYGFNDPFARQNQLAPQYGTSGGVGFGPGGFQMAGGPSSTVQGLAFNVGLGTPAGYRTYTQNAAQDYSMLFASPVDPLYYARGNIAPVLTNPYEQLFAQSSGRGFAKGGLVKTLQHFQDGGYVEVEFDKYGSEIDRTGKGLMKGMANFYNAKGELVKSVPVASGGSGAFATPQGEFSLSGFKNRGPSGDTHLGMISGGVGYSMVMGTKEKYNIDSLLKLGKQYRMEQNDEAWRSQVLSGDFAWDDRAGKFRSLLRLHPDQRKGDIGGIGTLGCVGTLCSPEEQKQLFNMLQSGEFKNIRVRYGQGILNELDSKGILAKSEPTGIRMGQPETMLAGQTQNIPVMANPTTIAPRVAPTIIEKAVKAIASEPLQNPFNRTNKPYKPGGLPSSQGMYKPPFPQGGRLPSMGNRGMLPKIAQPLENIPPSTDLKINKEWLKRIEAGEPILPADYPLPRRMPGEIIGRAPYKGPLMFAQEPSAPKLPASLPRAYKPGGLPSGQGMYTPPFPQGGRLPSMGNRGMLPRTPQTMVLPSDFTPTQDTRVFPTADAAMAAIPKAYKPGGLPAGQGMYTPPFPQGGRLPSMGNRGMLPRILTPAPMGPSRSDRPYVGSRGRGIGYSTPQLPPQATAAQRAELTPQGNRNLSKALQLPEWAGVPNTEMINRPAYTNVQDLVNKNVARTGLYTNVGVLMDMKKEDLSRESLYLRDKFSSFYSNKPFDRYRFGLDRDSFLGKSNFGEYGFNNYLKYIGFGGSSLSELSAFKFPMTPNTYSPYAFSSRYFGGFGGTGYQSGFNSLGTPFSNWFSAGSRLGIKPDWQARATGGMIYGGTSYKDDVPAMLMGGEYVIRKDIVDRMGEPFFNRLNRGQIQGFAEGGPVGTSLPSIGTSSDQTGQDNSRTQFVEALTKLLKSLDQLNRSVEDQTKEMKDKSDLETTTRDTTDGAGGVTNNINISVNVDQNGQTSGDKKDENQDSQGDDMNDQEKFKKTMERSRVLAELLRQQILKVITEEQRPGGVLYQGSKGRDLGR